MRRTLVKSNRIQEFKRKLSVLASLLCKKQVKQPVFLIGCARSGTTALASYLSTHKDIATYPTEANNLWHPRYYPWHTSQKDIPPLWVNPRAFTQHTVAQWTVKDKRNIHSLFGWYQAFSRKSHFFNKTAMASFMIPHILSVFPDAKFIHLYRDGRAVALSYAKKEMPKINAHQAYTEHRCTFKKLLKRMAHVWNETILEIDKVSKNLIANNQLIELCYEDFCSKPEDHLEKIATFLNLDSQRFRKKDFPGARSMNYKYKEELEPETLERIEKIMHEGLLKKNYVDLI